jgi:NTP pyrophosphatase (non-canonical NTP hydrolase)
MNINDYIKDLSIKDKKTLSQKALKLVEEIGELARVILPYDSAHGTNHRFTDKDAILEELVDIYLTNISISHSLGFTDEEFNDMLVKKTEKWSSLQAKEEEATFPLPFEIHVTVKPDNSYVEFSIDEFKKDCDLVGVKPIVIDLEINDGSIIKDVMTSSKFFGDNRTAYEESERIVTELKNRGYDVVRNKIETVPWHPAAPVISTGKEIPNGCYFESHIGIIISPEEKEDLNELVDFLNDSICEFSGTAKLSRNFFKKSESGKFVNMLTYRSNKIAYKEFESEVRSIEKIISGENDWSLLSNFKKFDYEKVELEYAVYDTNVTHDAKWILEK